MFTKILVTYIPSIHHVSLFWYDATKSSHDVTGIAEWEEDFLYVCMTCGDKNNFWQINCEKCDYLEAMANES